MPTRDDDGLHQLRVLRERRAHQQPAVGAADDRQLRRATCTSRRSGAASTAAKSSNTFCFFVRLPCAVPRLAELAAAAEVGHRDDEPVVEQHAVERPEPRRDAHAVAAVAGDQARVRAVAASCPCGQMMFTGTFVPSFDVGELAHHLGVVEIHRLVGA